MINPIGQFSSCWEEFKSFYLSGQVLGIGEGKGMPSDLIWNEEDFRFYLASAIEKHCPEKVMHLGVDIVKGRRVSLCIGDRDEWKKACSSKNVPVFDLVIEPVLINNDRLTTRSNYYSGTPHYNLPKARKKAEVLSFILAGGYARAAALCIINKVSFAADHDYDGIRQEYPSVSIFSVNR